MAALSGQAEAGWLVLFLTLFALIIAPPTGGEPRRERDLAQLCADCKLTSQSVDELVRRLPRQMNSYGQFDEQRVDLDKIKRAVCKEFTQDQERQRCRSFYFENLNLLERWKQNQESSSSGGRMTFYDFVCIRESKYCCPSGSYGPKCSRCPKCAPDQQCQGESTRSGEGKCVCKRGHTGRQCKQCLRGYYLDENSLKLAENSSQRLLCKPCHRSCEYCRQPGPKGCEVCRKGFTLIPGFGCSDVDECLQSGGKICGQNTFCVNTEGSHFCYECDRACSGCHGDGPDMCLACAKGYKLDQGNCVAERKTILPPEANYYRYAIYVGLCLCTCIILHTNVYLASIVGLGVALYIGASEYVMSGHPGLPTADEAAARQASFAGQYHSHLGL